MSILVINAGSSSLKYQLIDSNTEKVQAKGIVERIGIPHSVLKHTAEGKEKYIVEKELGDHNVAVELVLKVLLDDKYGVIKDLKEIRAVGHRVLHGGPDFSVSQIVTEPVLRAIEDNIVLGPLHNPANLMGIRACMKVMPGVPQVAVFDTAFGQTMPPKAYLYGLPYEAYTKHKVRRYGFHGTSHRYVSMCAAELMGNPKQLKLITCHLGNGSSLSAVQDGKCVDTSMGLTPLEGVIMGTRCGSIDPAIVKYMMERENMTIEEMDNYMNKKSGVLGLSGISSDFRDLSSAADAGNERAKMALEAFAYSVKKYFGSYAAAMGGLDCIAFTAGIGENDPEMRAKIMDGLEWMGIELDPEKNSHRGVKMEISKPTSRVRVFVIPTNEELMIARDTLKLLSK